MKECRRCHGARLSALQNHWRRPPMAGMMGAVTLRNVLSFRLAFGSLIVALVVATPFALLWRPAGWIWVPVFAGIWWWAQTRAREAPLYCPHCRKGVKTGATACHHCGRSVI